MSKIVKIPNDSTTGVYHVTVNGKEYRYICGEEVEVPDEVAEIIEHSEKAREVKATPPTGAVLDTNGKLLKNVLPEGYPYAVSGLVEILPETTVTSSEDEDMDGVAPITYPIGLKANEEYIVNWNGTEYTTVGLEYDMDGVLCVWLGNFDLMMGLGDSGHPFVICEYPAEFAANVGMNGVVILIDGSLTSTLSIYCNGESVHKLDNKYLDLDWLPTKEPYERVVLGEISSSDFFLSIHEDSLSVGDTVIVVFDGVRYERTLINYDNTLYYAGNGSLLSDILLDTGEPFCLFLGIDSDYYGLRCDDQTHTISVSVVDYKYNKIPEGYLVSTYVADLFSLGMSRVKENTEIIFATDTSAIIETLDNGGKVQIVIPVDVGGTAPSVTAILDGSKHGNSYHYSTLLHVNTTATAQLNALTLDVADGKITVNNRKLVDYSA